MIRQPPRRRVALPVVGQQGGIRRSRAGVWRAGVLIAVHVALLAHIVHWLVAGSTLTPLEPSEAMELGRRDVVNAGLVLFLLAAAATAVFGRFFCGWGCHLVALQDLCQGLLRRVGIRPLPLRSRLLAWVPTLAFVYMFLWPAAYRLATGDDFGPLHLDLVTADFWATFPGWAVGIATFAVCGFAIVYLLGAKGFCTYACPYGALFGAADRLAPGRIRVNDSCDGCAHCTAVCTSNVRVHEEVRDFGMVVDPGCMKCLDCVSVCPRDALSFGFGRPSLLARPRVTAPVHRPPAWRWSEELVLALGGGFAFFSVRGLYGWFPFLFTLGLAACYAFIALTVWRFLVEPNLAVRRVQLQRAGRPTRVGVAFLALWAGATGFCAHSALVRYDVAVGGWEFVRLAPLRAAALRADARPALTAGERARVESAHRRLDRARRRGLAAQPGLALPLAWTAYLSGRSEEIAARAAEASPARDAIEAWKLAARAARGGERMAEAETAYRRALALASDDESLYLDLGSLLSLVGRHTDAAEIFEQGRARLPNSAALAYNAALNRALEGRRDEAIALCREALRLDPHLDPAAGLLADLEAQLAR